MVSTAKGRAPLFVLWGVLLLAATLPAFAGDTLLHLSFDKLEEGGDGYVYVQDSSPLKNKCRVVGSGYSIVDGVSGKGLMLSGRKNLVSMPPNPQMDISMKQGFTIRFWFRPEASMNTGGSKVLVATKQDTSPGGWRLAYSPAPARLNFSFAGEDRFKPASVDSDPMPVPFKPGVWYHLAVTGKNGRISFFMNGVEYSRKDVAGDIPPAKEGLRIGAYKTTPGIVMPCEGAFDDLKIETGAAAGFPGVAEKATVKVPAARFVDRDVRENLALRKPYAWTHEPNYRYGESSMCTDAGDKTDLTDGVYSKGQWWDKGMVGWMLGTNTLELTVDLRQEEPISGIMVRAACTEAGRFLPGIDFFVKDADGGYLPLGSVEKPSDEERKGATYWEYRLDGLKAAGRLIVIKFRHDQTLFLDEIEIYKGNFGVGEASMDRSLVMSSTQLHPYYKQSDACIVREDTPGCPALPLMLRGGALFILDLPEGITLHGSQKALCKTESIQRDGSRSPGSASNRW